ncbi:MAG: hypothetical protein M3044_23400 [Thermoproteota archaeon]|nr:hypothetical protein [Thermoproteota archaeon]
MSADYLYENFRRALIEGLHEKYRYLRRNTTIYHNYTFHINQIREPGNKHDSTNKLIPPPLNGFGFSAPDEPLIRRMLLRFQNETGYVIVNLNNSTFRLSDTGINYLIGLDPTLE